jgi:hypothetical protein
MIWYSVRRTDDSIEGLILSLWLCGYIFNMSKKKCFSDGTVDIPALVASMSLNDKAAQFSQVSFGRGLD